MKHVKTEHADVAQLAEQLICNQQVNGSSPRRSTYCDYSWLQWHQEDETDKVVRNPDENKSSTAREDGRKQTESMGS